MHLLNHEQRAGISAGVEALIIGEASLGAPTGPVAAVESCGGRVVAQVDWQDAVERITAMSARPIILMEAAALGDEALATALARLDGLAAGRDLALIVGITEHQIDLSAAGLVQSRYEILCDPAEADWITALATAHLADPLVLHDRVSEGNIGRIAQLNAEVARITNVLANLTRHETPIRPPRSTSLSCRATASNRWNCIRSHRSKCGRSSARAGCAIVISARGCSRIRRGT